MTTRIDNAGKIFLGIVNIFMSMVDHCHLISRPVGTYPSPATEDELIECKHNICRLNYFLNPKYLPKFFLDALTIK